MSDSVRPHRWQPTRLRGPWDSPGKNTGVGYHFLLRCMKVKSESEVTQLCLTLRNLMNYSPSGSSVHRILQARILEWVTISFSRRSSWLRDQTWVSCIAELCLREYILRFNPHNSLARLLLFSRSAMSHSLRVLGRNTPDLPVLQHLLELAQTHVGDAIQPSYPLSFPSPPAFNLSQQQGLFQGALHIKWPKY